MWARGEWWALIVVGELNKHTRFDSPDAGSIGGVIIKLFLSVMVVVGLTGVVNKV